MWTNSLSNKWYWDNWVSTCKRMNLDSPRCTLDSTLIKGLNIKAGTMQLSGETGIKLYDLGLGKGFLDITANAQEK